MCIVNCWRRIHRRECTCRLGRTSSHPSQCKSALIARVKSSVYTTMAHFAMDEGSRRMDHNHSISTHSSAICRRSNLVPCDVGSTSTSANDGGSPGTFPSQCDETFSCSNCSCRRMVPYTRVREKGDIGFMCRILLSDW